MAESHPVSALVEKHREIAGRIAHRHRDIARPGGGTRPLCRQAVPHALIALPVATPLATGERGGAEGQDVVEDVTVGPAPGILPVGIRMGVAVAIPCHQGFSVVFAKKLTCVSIDSPRYAIILGG